MSASLASQARIVNAFVPRRRRGAELFLLVLALIVGVGAYALVGIGTKGRVPADIFEYGGGMVALAAVAHIVVRMKAPYADPVLLPAVVALNGIGLAMIHRIDIGRVAAVPDSHTYATQQLMWTAVSVVGFVATLIVIRDHRRLQAFTYTLGFAGIVLLLLPLAPGLGVDINGARIWIHISSFSIQPGEFAKICLAIFFAGYLVLKRDALALAGHRFIGIDLPRGRDLGPILLMWLVSLGILVFQNDLGSSLMFFGLFVVLLYVATERPSWLVVGSGLFLIGAY
ncbi:MAG: FtsW/RodA/SpoVE family cell cycle protein, partial [Nocardioidaceae bacterium]